MDADVILKENLIKWVDNNKGKDNQLAVYWRMFQVRSMSSNPMKSTPCIGFNLQVDNLEESIEMLMENLGVLTHVRFVCVRFMRTSNDNHYLTHHLINPFWSKEVDINSTSKISGLNGNILGLNHQYVSAIQSIHEQEKLVLESKLVAQIEAIKTEFLHKNEIKELKEEIAGLKNNQSSFLGDIIKDLKEPITTLCGAWAAKMVAPDQNNESTQEIEQAGTQQADSSNRQFDPILDNIKNYPHYADLLSEIAILAKLDPHKLHDLRLSINAAAAETQQKHSKQ